uniref:ABC transporter permease n=1 Tax=Anaerococcus mediterraneensis TaxID=1870984 RepID=UPI000930B2EB|nr:FtsX-like permease family protein [Anaerococcus mediterraneensis]
MKRDESSKKLYILILILSSIASYIILSIDRSEVFYYIYEENRYYLLDTIRTIYFLSLFFIFILIYYASFFVISEKKDQIGLYMAEGMERKNLFLILFRSSLTDIFRANLLGLGLSLFINEFINLLTVRVLSLGLNNHNFTISIKAIFLTIFISVILNCISTLTIVRDFYKERTEKIFRGEMKSRSDSLLFIGLSLFLFAFILGKGYLRLDIFPFVGLMGVFIYIYFWIISKIFEKTANKDLIVRKSLSLSFKKDKASLFFTSFMLICGILILTYTIFASISSRDYLKRPADFTLYDSKENIDRLKSDEDLMQMIGETYPVYGYEFMDIDTSFLDNEVRNNLLLDKNSRSNFFFVPRFLLSSSSFENIYKEGIKLEEDEAIILTSSENEKYCLEKTLDQYESYIKVGGLDLKVRPLIKSNKIFSNDVIGLSSMVVVNDSLYEKLIGKKDPFAYNINLSKDFVNAFGFSKGSDMLREEFIKKSYKYESYIWQAKNTISEIVRNLYTNFYLSLIFILVSLCFFTIRIFISFEKSKDKLLILSLMGEDMKEIRAVIKREYMTMFASIFFVSILAAIFLFYTLPFGFEMTLQVGKGKIIQILGLVSLGLIFLVSLCLKLIIKVSYERMISYEEDYNS